MFQESGRVFLYFTLQNDSPHVHSYPSSILYIRKFRNEFEYSFYYKNFCKGMYRDQVAMKFKKDLQDSLFDVDAADSLARNWLKEQIDNNAPVILT